MFYYLNGVVAHMAPFLAVIDCGGVGYACRTTNNTLSHLQKGKPAKLYTHLNVREDAMELFGFSTENELNCFQLLTSVSGVGPKAALSILSAATPESLAMSIITGDEKALTVAQGIGKKIAQRIILELKDKLDLAEVFEQKLNADRQQEAAVSAGSGMVQDAVEALVALGYGSTEALRAVRAVKADTVADSEQLLKEALKHML